MTTSHRLLGSGEKKVLALHGWFGSATGWGCLPEYLDTATYTWAFLDYRGYGGAKERPGEHTMEEIGDDAVRLADELGWDGFDVVGHWMGGMAAQRVLLHALERVRRCELEVLPNAGHYAMFETPVALATSIEEFLGRP